MKLTVRQLLEADARDPSAVPRLARALGLRGDAPIFIICARCNDVTFGIATHWLSTYRFRARLAEQGAA